jgi:hypothetical protein
MSGSIRATWVLSSISAPTQRGAKTHRDRRAMPVMMACAAESTGVGAPNLPGAFRIASIPVFERSPWLTMSVSITPK